MESVISVRQNNQQSRRRRTIPPEQYKKQDVRLKSFQGIDWPRHIAAQPEMLAKAGFYYIGPDDRVKCGYCGGVLKRWAKDDSPIEEHIKHYPECAFVKTVEKQTQVLAKTHRTEVTSND